MRRNVQAGFTLLEMMVGAVITSIILMAVASVFIVAQGTYQREAQTKTVVEGSRTAVSYVEGMLKLAGYGIDPARAFDFNTAGLAAFGNTKDNYDGGAFITDDLAFRYRNPAWVRRGSLGAADLTLTLTENTSNTFGTALKQGQPVMVACRGGQDYFLGVTTAAVAANAGVVTLSPYNTVYPNATAFPTTAPACARSTAGESAFVLLIHDLRFRIVDLGGRPFLVVFHNMGAPNPDVNTDFDPIAADVENFQVAYTMNRPFPTSDFIATAAPDAAGNGNWVMGDHATDGLPNPAAIAPAYLHDYDASQRYTAHPANIRAVRISLVTRSSREMERRETPIKLENEVVDATADGYYRTSVSLNLKVPNMLSRSSFTPALTSEMGTDDDFNHSGG